MTLPRLIDLETKLVVALIADEVLDGNISTRLPRDFRDHLPYATLSRAPGSAFIDANTQTLEAARLQLNTYDIDDVDAFEAMADLIAGINAREGLGLGDPPDAFITNVDITPPWWHPDPETELAGYLANVSLFVKGYATVS